MIFEGQHGCRRHQLVGFCRGCRLSVLRRAFNRDGSDRPRAAAEAMSHLGRFIGPRRLVAWITNDIGHALVLGQVT